MSSSIILKVPLFIVWSGSTFVSGWLTVFPGSVFYVSVLTLCAFLFPNRFAIHHSDETNLFFVSSNHLILSSTAHIIFFLPQSYSLIVATVWLDYLEGSQQIIAETWVNLVSVEVPLPHAAFYHMLQRLSHEGFWIWGFLRWNCWEWFCLAYKKRFVNLINLLILILS